MSWAGIIGGAMVGGGAAWQQVARDRDLAAQRESLEAARAKADMDRQTALEALRAANQRANTKYANDMAKETRIDELTGDVGKAKITATTATAEADLEFRTRPDVVEAEAKRTAAIEDAKGFTLAPGQERHLNGKVTKNTTPTAAEINEQLYREGLRAPRGAKATDPYTVAMKDLDKDDDAIAKEQRALRAKLATDEALNNPESTKRVEAEITRLQQERDQIATRKIVTAIENDQLDAVANMRSVAPRIQTTEQLNKVVQNSIRLGGKEWGAKVEGALIELGVMNRLSEQNRVSNEAQRATDFPGRPGIVNGEAPGNKPPPTGDRSINLLDRESREIEQGLRTSMSPEAQAESAAASKKFKDDDAAYLQAEQQRQLQQARGIVGGQMANQANAVNSLTPQTIATLTAKDAESILRRFAAQLSTEQREALQKKVR